MHLSGFLLLLSGSGCVLYVLIPFFQVLDAVSGALIGAFTWWNLGFVAPALAFVFKRKLPVSLCTHRETHGLKFGFVAVCAKSQLQHPRFGSCLQTHVALLGRDWPIVHGIPQWSLPSPFIPAKAKALPREAASTHVAS